MNTKLSKKRGGDTSNEDPPKKMVLEKLEALDSVSYDVTIIVDGREFQCLKENLSEHSMYFQRMFNSNFQEKDKKEVALGGMVESETFDMFLKVVHGEDLVTDDTVEELLELAVYLESTTLEAHCVQHLRQKTDFSLQKQFQMAETYHSEKLIIQVCSSIRDAYELDEVVPKDLDSLCNTTKNLVMQRSFELLGIRKPPSPPLPEEPDQVFEHLLNQMVDQVEVVNHHGEVLKEQTHLLFEHLFIEKHFRGRYVAAEGIFRDDPLIKELLNELPKAHEQGERNFIHAQISVLKFKHFYTRLQSQEFIFNETDQEDLIRTVLQKLTKLPAILNRDQRSQFRSQKVTLGNREIDETFRTITAEAKKRNQEEPPRNVSNSAAWIHGIYDIYGGVSKIARITQHQIQRPRPDNQRKISNGASFRIFDEFINNIRNVYYGVPYTRRG